MIDSVKTDRSSDRRQSSGKNTADEASPFVTAFLARTVMRKFWLATLLAILIIIFSLMILFTMDDLKELGTQAGEESDLLKEQASFTITVLSIWAGIFIIALIGLLISAYQNYRGSFKNLSDLLSKYRLTRKDKLTSAAVSCPKCGDTIRMTDGLSNGKCISCGFEVYPKRGR